MNLRLPSTARTIIRLQLPDHVLHTGQNVCEHRRHLVDRFVVSDSVRLVNPATHDELEWVSPVEWHHGEMRSTQSYGLRQIDER